VKLTGTNRPITYTTHPPRERTLQKPFAPKGRVQRNKTACVHYVVPKQQTPHKGTVAQEPNHNRITCCNTTDFPATPQGAGGGARVTAVIARGKRPVPFRTRKLRPAAPMVLHPGGCGRVGHRRNTIQVEDPNHQVGVLPHLNTPKCARTADESGEQFWHIWMADGNLWNSFSRQSILDPSIVGLYLTG
jgi:hypothetical protein